MGGPSENGRSKCLKVDGHLRLKMEGPKNTEKGPPSFTFTNPVSFIKYFTPVMWKNTRVLYQYFFQISTMAWNSTNEICVSYSLSNQHDIGEMIYFDNKDRSLRTNWKFRGIVLRFYSGRWFFLRVEPPSRKIHETIKCCIISSCSTKNQHFSYIQNCSKMNQLSPKLSWGPYHWSLLPWAGI